MASGSSQKTTRSAKGSARFYLNQNWRQASFFDGIGKGIKLLAPGTVQFAVTIHQDAVGEVEVEPSKTSWTKNGSNSSSSSSPAKEGTGKIVYELNGLSLEIPLHANDCDLHDFPRKGDIVR